MGIKSIKGSPDLAKDIRDTRIKLGLTIEEAAHIAGVGTKTWSRYEAGESIRKDKWTGICRALNWKKSHLDVDFEDSGFDINKYRNNKYWSQDIAGLYGDFAAASFIIGSELLTDNIDSDLEQLSKLPRGSHLGEIYHSYLVDDLPPQFLTRYDYEFVYALKCSLFLLREKARYGVQMLAHSVIEELIFYLIVEETRYFLEMNGYIPDADWDEWIFDMFGDEDIITLLYSDMYLTEGWSYHFDHWLEEQFYMER